VTADDEGSAMVEFVGLSLLLLLPLLYLVLTVFTVQRTTFGATAAAREAGRAYATAPTEAAALERARYAARLALQDQGVGTEPELAFAPAGAGCDGAGGDAASLSPGARFVICVRTTAALPFADRGLLREVTGGGVGVTGQFAVAVDRYRAAR
jgi:Flp pilus assembly protein TadG